MKRRGHPQFRCQVSSAEMDVQHGRTDIAVTRKGSDFVQFPVRTGKVGETKMPEAVGRELGYACVCRDPLDDL